MREYGDLRDGAVGAICRLTDAGYYSYKTDRKSVV